MVAIQREFILQACVSASLFVLCGGKSSDCHMGSINLAQQHPSWGSQERRGKSAFSLPRHSCGTDLLGGCLGSRRSL